MFRGQNRNDSDGNLAPQMASEAISGHLIYKFFLAWERGEGVEAGACILLPPLGYLLHTNFRPWYKETVKHIPPMQPMRPAV